MDRYEGFHTALTVALYGVIYKDIVMGRYEGTHIASHRVLYIAIIMNQNEGPTMQLL
jgi:hypothetical protein